MSETKIVKDAPKNMHSNAGSRKLSLLSIRSMTAMALLAALAAILMLFEIPLWFIPKFYELDFSEVPVLIGAFALGPVAGVVIELIKILINLLINGTDTAFIGELANFLLGCSLVVPGSIIYKAKKSRKAAIIGVVAGTFTFCLVGCLLNAYLLLPAYSKMFMPLDAIIAVGTEVNRFINNMTTFIVYGVLPFNLIKGICVSAITVALYKYVSPIIKGFHD